MDVSLLVTAMTILGDTRAVKFSIKVIKAPEKRVSPDRFQTALQGMGRDGGGEEWREGRRLIITCTEKKLIL